MDVRHLLFACCVLAGGSAPVPTAGTASGEEVSLGVSISSPPLPAPQVEEGPGPFRGRVDATESGANTSLAPREGVLVLRNGHVLRGHVTSLGDYYVVTFNEQGMAKLPVSAVEMSCSSLEDAYSRKRDAIPAGNVTTHLELADWCLQNNLTARGADQTLVAHMLDPRNPRVAALERRLALLSQEGLNRTDAPARKVVASSPAVPEIDLRELPAGAIEYFTQKIQPILLNRCATNACHGVRSERSFELIRPLRGQSIPVRLTQRNLRSALHAINLQVPDESPLLTQPRKPHGGLAEPIFTEREMGEHQRLVSWVRLLAVPSSASPPDNGPRPENGEWIGLAAWRNDAPQPSPSEPHSAAGTKSGVLRLDKLPDSTPPTDTNDSSPGGRPAELFRPRDPFDPEVFNRRLLPSPSHGQGPAPYR